ncbi:MAG TPA: GGDEF domain-containing protein [Acidisphaera sp.]|nr:GGDEF domain-containing protein [Acidisphaera sp.]
MHVAHSSHVSTASAPDEPDAVQSDAALLDAIDTALAAPTLPALQPPLDGRYHAYIAATRRISIRQWLLSLVFVQAFGFAADMFAATDHLAELAAVRLVGVPLALGALLAAWMQRSEAAARWLTALVVVALSAVLQIGVAAATARQCGALHADRTFVTTFCICFLAAVVPRLSRREMIAYAIAIETVFVGVMISAEELPLRAQCDMIIFTGGVLLLSTLMRGGVDRARMRNFLRAERNEVLARQLVRANTALAEVNNDLQDTNGRLLQLSTTDALTGVANRRHLDSVLEAEWRRAAVGREWLALLMIDVDRFKSLNDAAGHERGDAALQAVAHALIERTRRGRDLVARYGGDEFVVLLPGATQAVALRMAERFCETIRELRLQHPAHDGALTISVGAAACIPPPGAGPTELLQAADAALYRAKQSGRDAARMTGAGTSDAVMQA